MIKDIQMHFRDGATFVPLAPALGESAVGSVAEQLAACPGVTVLVTSRERLHLLAEQRYRVPRLAPDDALALFAERAATVNSGFTVTGANRPTLETICRRLDCLPLAIELCATQSDLLAPTQLLAQLQERPQDLLVDGAHDLLSRQRTLRTAIEHSYHLLAEEQRTLWRALGVFAGGFDLEAATRVADANAATLRALAGKNLIHVEMTMSGEQRSLLLDTLREFAVEQICAHGKEAEIQQRHYQAYLHLFHTGDSQLRGVAIAIAHNQPLTLCECQPLLAIVHLYRGDEAEANRLLEDSLRLSLLVKNTDYLAGVCAYLAEAALWEWTYDAASRWLAQSLVYQGPTKYITINELQRLFIALRLAAAQGDYRQAAAPGGLFETAHAQLHSIYGGPMLPLVDAALAEARAALGSPGGEGPSASAQRSVHVSVSVMVQVRRIILSMHLASQVCDGIRSGFFYKKSTELRVMTILGPENTLGYVADLTDN